jgi:signal transduction histidine kinase/CheY-like chemotaxis protein
MVDVPEPEARYRSVFEAMKELAVIHELVRDVAGRAVDYRIVDCNPAFSEVTGIARERAVGRLASEVYGTGEAPYLDTYARVADSGEPEHFETYFAPLQKHFTISVTSPRRGTFVTIAHDVTELRRTADELREDERRLQALYDLSLTSFTDEQQLVDHAIREAVRITRSTFGWIRLAPPGGAPDPGTVPTQEPGGAEGAPAIVRQMSTPVFDCGRVVAMAGVANKPEPYTDHDMRQVHLFFDGVWRRAMRLRAEADRKKLELQVQHAQKLESLGVLAGGIAHDFNNLLACILGNIDVALEELSPVAPAREPLADAQAAGRRAAELVRQMLAYSGRGRFVVQPIDVRALIEEIAHILQVSITKKAVLRFNFTEGLPAIHADAAQLRQVVMNLILNASDAIGDRSGVITVSTGAMDCDRQYLRETWLDDDLAPGQYVYVEVTDTGCGMDEATRGKIFDPFFTTKMAGRGLGLAAVLGIVRGHRGAIKVYSEPGKGTTFKALFPASEQLACKLDAPTPAAEWRGSGRLLLVDDEESVRSMGRRLLSRLGFEVVTARDGREALELFRGSAARFACVVLDLTMPHLNGEETYRELRRLDPAVRVLLSSGYSEHEITERFAGKGIAGFIPKPYQIATVAAALRAALEAP